MPDAIHFRDAPADWRAAFAALPAEEPPVDAWARIAARLDPPRTHSRQSLWLAIAAALVLALAWPWHLQHEASTSTPSTPVARNMPAAATSLDRLYAESARLEALVAYARDDQVATGNAAVLAARYDARIADIDAALGQSDLPSARQQALWQARVATLRALAAFEANRRWLATQGERYDGALARVD